MTRAPTWPALAGVALCLAACGSDSGSGGDAKKLQVETTGGGKNVQIKAPKSVEGGLVEMSLKNSAKDPQEAQLIKVDGDHSEEEVLKTLGSEGGPIPSWLSGGGGVGGTNPGHTRTATQKLSPGKYYVVDTNVLGKPAVAPLTVEGGDGGDLPSTDATVTAEEYGFTVSGLKEAATEVTFKNTGKQLHHVIALPIKKGKTIDDVKKAFQEENPSGPPPFNEDAAVGTSVIDGGESQVIDLPLDKGKYAFACFIQDRKGGPPHVAKGMVTEVDVE